MSLFLIQLTGGLTLTKHRRKPILRIRLSNAYRSLISLIS